MLQRNDLNSSYKNKKYGVAKLQYKLWFHRIGRRNTVTSLHRFYAFL